MDCSDCPQKDNHRYVWGKRLAGFGKMPPAAFALLDRKLKNRTQCQCISRFNLAMTEVIIECCRDTALTPADTAGWNLDDYAVWTAEKARDYIQANEAEWEVHEKPAP